VTQTRAKYISTDDNKKLYDMIGEVYFTPHPDKNDYDLIHGRLEALRNDLAKKYNYDRSNYGVDIESGMIVRLHN
jgi:hypothetical protein